MTFPAFLGKDSAFGHDNIENKAEEDGGLQIIYSKKTEPDPLVPAKDPYQVSMDAFTV